MSDKLLRFADISFQENEENRVEGIAAVFNQTTDLGWFTEEIAPEAFNNADMSDVVLNFNHDDSILLAGTRNGSLQLQVRDNGLFQSSKVINTTQGEDVMKLVKAGLISKMSFAFSISEDGEEWSKRDGKEHRVIRSISKLYDVSLVTFPAYSGTEAWSRANSDELAEKHKALMQRRKEQDKKMEELLNGKNLIK